MNQVLRLLLLLFVSTAGTQLVAQAESWTPKRINKVIELLEMDEPVYYTQIADYGYDECQGLAGTEADYISINMEHSYVDVRLLRDCMRGLVDAGPTRSGHRTPAVIAVLPAWAWTETQMRANAYLVQQIMGAGVHGMLLTHAADPAAVRIMVETIRYPFAPPVAGLAKGMQGSGSAAFPANIWGISGNDYLNKADPWPMNPEGEFFIGLKIENTIANQNVEQLVRIPGIAFVEHGPGDQRYWHGGPGVAETRQGELDAVRELVFRATKDAGIYFLGGCTPAGIDEGVRVCGIGSAAVGRAHTGRRMPW